MRSIFRYVRTGAMILSFGVACFGQVPGKVVGSIFDGQDAVILGTQVKISNPSFQKSLYPDPKTGQFGFEVPPGVYTITTEHNLWFPVRRAMFAVRERETVVINLQPRIRILSQALVLTEKGVRDDYERNKPAKTFEFLPFASSPLNVLIEYEKSTRRGTSTEYRNATLTYAATSVSANLIIVERRELTVTAAGLVTVDENGVRRRLETTTLKILEITTP